MVLALNFSKLTSQGNEDKVCSFPYKEITVNYLKN